MSAADVTLQQADAESTAYVESLLERNDLPSADVRSKPGCFYVASADGIRVGVGGLEVHDGHGLLRSVVVEESVRDQGHGSAICAALEERARESGVETLYLLTTTAAAFFADRGYAEIDRAEAPDTIQETTEFAELCPSSAACLSRRL